ncbi:UDP-N-acetylmuramoylalanine--D-glutamate ligase [Kineothrix alysoides]|uniref:UDP-N-acetylmuramoylalanine--D-glutamate ligase n=1 Tax=Kineothrix alysoides TaxID=1469948 RepID=A0A4V2QCF6_9FIRM|nr:UDP-N-acetylmuramoyl-L-alanine--D-glutamate ligase [Kineothrix alysoides]TCL60077.1 UDP-N-acetylmuramoylalanine--D-glutamate ligase [Kineothrix alysoides]
MDLHGKKVLVIGTGISGIGAVKLLDFAGAAPVLYDENKKLEEAVIRNKLPEGINAEIVIGSLPKELEEEIVLVVPSPGVPADTAFIEGFRERGIPVWGEIELAYTYAKGKLIAITGTNGKTTTTSLVGQIMEEYYESVYIVGNIGNPYTEIASETKEDTITVAEISSFQLETTHTFKPQVSAILNVTPDHLDRHYTMENYAAVKERIAGNQTKDDVCVLNYENEYTKNFGSVCPAQVIFFSSARKLERGIYLEGEDIYIAGIGDAQDDRRKIMTVHDMNLVGLCNVENVMAAIAIALSIQVPLENILSTVKHFKAVAHRIEFVATKNGVDYYNDSKGTNPDAAIQGIRAMSKPTVLIGGGYDKHSEYDEWIEAFDGKVKCFVLIGQTADKIEKCAVKHGIGNIIRANSFDEALKVCTREAEAGDAVLLSPACASWGMFSNYEVRGNMFKDYVNSL